MTLKQKILDHLMDPNVAFILLADWSLLSLYVEFNHPGAVVPGSVGIIFLLLAGFALNLLPVRFAALALIQSRSRCLRWRPSSPATACLLREASCCLRWVDCSWWMRQSLKCGCDCSPRWP